MSSFAHAAPSHHQPHARTVSLPKRAAQDAKHSAKLAAERITLAVHKTHLAQIARNAALRGQKAQAKMAQAKQRHQQKLAMLKAVMQQQHLAQVEVRMQRTLTQKAQKMALRQQQFVLHQRKAQMKLAALRHKSLMRLAKLETQQNALSSGNVVMAAYALRGTRYVMGGTSRSGFDCSGFVRYVLSTTDGVAIPRTAAEQYYHGLAIPVKQMEPGDLVFFKNTYKHGISHVGIYAGQGKFIHAANAHKGVRIDSLNTAYYWQHFAGARRVLPSQMRQAAFLH